MTGEIIKSFLVGLGFDVDDASLAKFNKSIASASLRVAALFGTIQTASAGIFYSTSKISEGFEEIGYSLRLVAPAVNKFLILRNAMLDAYRRAGIDLTQVVKQSILFNYSLAKTKFALEAIYKSVAAKFFPILTKQLDIFRQKIFANMPKIQAQLETFTKFLFRAFDATIIFGARVWSILGRAYDFFKLLDTATNGWSTKILAVVAAWDILNLSFIATPLGAIITGIITLIALYDDFKVWQSGGDAYFNWSKAIPSLEGVADVLGGILGIILSIANALKHAFGLDFKSILSDLNDIATAFIHIGEGIERIGRGLQLPIIDKILDAVLLKDFAPTNANAALNSVTQPSPLTPSNSSSSVRMNQENVNNFYGVPGASEAVSSFADKQQENNSQLIRYFTGTNGQPVTR